MATAKESQSHLERTAAEPRDNSLHKVIINRIDEVNSTIRLFQLQPLPSQTPIKFFPGQWLDVHVPGIYKAGGFTITSTPSKLHLTSPYLELAIQSSPYNPPAAWLWQPQPYILGEELQVRVGGSFIWPPPTSQKPKRVVFVAGGVGINPLISMVGFLKEWKETRGKLGFDVKFLYSTKESTRGSSGEILFLSRLKSVFESLGEEGDLRVFLTLEKGQSADSGSSESEVSVRRISDGDLEDALGPVNERNGTICYVCGVPTMTDEFVEKVKRAEGIVESNVLFEKWW